MKPQSQAKQVHRYQSEGSVGRETNEETTSEKDEF
jgi:hypothetical protein